MRARGRWVDVDGDPADLRLGLAEDGRSIECEVTEGLTSCSFFADPRQAEQIAAAWDRLAREVAKVKVSRSSW